MQAGHRNPTGDIFKATRQPLAPAYRSGAAWGSYPRPKRLGVLMGRLFALAILGAFAVALLTIKGA